MSEVIVAIAGGTGKSRTIAVATLATLLWLNCSKVHILVPNLALLKRDSTEFKDYYALAGVEERVEYHSGLDFKLSKTEVLIVDEADYFALQDPTAFECLISNSRCLGLSATATEYRPGSIDTEIFAALNFS
jgi:hypothetical protein